MARRKKGHGFLKAFLGTLLALIVVAAGVLAVLYFWDRPFTRTVSLSEDVAVNTYVWLSDVEGMTLTYSDIKDQVGAIDLEIAMTPTGKSHLYTQEVSAESYTECEKKAKAGLKNAFIAVAKEQLGDSADVSALMEDTFGVTVEEYLESCNLTLLPTLESLQDKYSGEYENKIFNGRDFEYRKNFKVSVDGKEPVEVAGLEFFYENNMMLSIRGLADALDGSNIPLDANIDSSLIQLWTVDSYSGGSQVWTESELAEPMYVTYKFNDLYINYNNRQYASIICKMSSGKYDAFMSTLDLALLLNFDMDYRDGVIYINTSQEFCMTPDKLEETGLFMGVNGLIVGDGTTGDIYYSYHDSESHAIASTTKLMTYLCTMEAISNGEISYDDKVVITPEAAKLSKSDDGTTPMRAGMTIGIDELLRGTLLPSSNECAYSLAVHVAGSEEAFVGRMNAMANDIGMTDTIYYNCHGLPHYEGQIVNAKMQNHASAKDLFTLASYIMQEYPQVTDITSLKVSRLSALGMEVMNTNSLLFNIDEVKGLKTGTTNKAGACLVTVMPVEKAGVCHNLIVVELGAEQRYDRNRVSELLARYALTALEASDSNDPAVKAKVMPKDPNLVIKRLVAAANK